MEEEWKLIPNSKNYQINNFGRVRKVYANNSYKEITGNKRKNGYLVIGIQMKNGKREFFLKHRLVAELFIPHSEYEWIVRHKDNDLSNNSVDNLYWLKTDIRNRKCYLSFLKNRL